MLCSLISEIQIGIIFTLKMKNHKFDTFAVKVDTPFTQKIDVSLLMRFEPGRKFHFFYAVIFPIDA